MDAHPTVCFFASLEGMNVPLRADRGLEEEAPALCISAGLRTLQASLQLRRGSGRGLLSLTYGRGPCPPGDLQQLRLGEKTASLRHLAPLPVNPQLDSGLAAPCAWHPGLPHRPSLAQSPRRSASPSPGLHKGRSLWTLGSRQKPQLLILGTQRPLDGFFTCHVCVWS